MNRKGFTLIELLIVVVIIGILAAIAIPKFANTKAKAYIASMKSDLRNLVTAQEAFFSDNNDYAGSTVSTAQTNGTGGAGKVSFVPSKGNVLALTYVDAAGWKATMTNPAAEVRRSSNAASTSSPRPITLRSAAEASKRSRRENPPEALRP